MTTLSIHRLGVDLGGRAVLDQAEFEVTGGTLLGIAGPNGAGKTTLARAMAGLISPQRGAVMLDGVLLPAIKPALRARRIAYLAQGGQVHWPLTVARLVALGRMPHLSAFQRLTPKERLTPKDEAAIARALSRADATHLADRVMSSLSGGERALALVARALAVEADILIADEPAAALDPAHQLQVLDVLAEEAARGAAVIAVMHDLSLARRFCHRLLLVHGGRVLADGPPGEVLTKQNLENVFSVEAALGVSNGVPVVTTLRRLKR